MISKSVVELYNSKKPFSINKKLFVQSLFNEVWERSIHIASMLVKSFDPLEALNDPEFRLAGCSTPHRINMTSSNNSTNNNEEEEAEVANQPTMNITNKNCNAFKLRVSKKRSGKQIATKTSQQCPLGIKMQKSSEIIKKNTQILNNRKLTDFFPVRRSIRKCKKTVLEEIQRDFENKIRNGVEDGLQVKRRQFALSLLFLIEIFYRFDILETRVEGSWLPETLLRGSTLLSTLVSLLI